MDTVKARKHMVDSQVRPNDVTDIGLQAAMGNVPRERFVPANRRALAYVEQDVPLFEGRHLLKARDFAKLIDAANVQPGDLILDVGCGYGYSSAVLAQIGGVVVALEESQEVVDKASSLFSAFSIDNAVSVQGPLAEGYAKQAPFDVIVVAGGVEEGLDQLFSQLKEDVGRLVTIKMHDRVGTATLFTRSGTAYGERRLFEAHPAETIPAFRKKQQFQF
ncbi:MAG: protein-L-isoaspartate O-methyltransferase [Pseudomonadota bacterium]